MGYNLKNARNGKSKIGKFQAPATKSKLIWQFDFLEKLENFYGQWKMLKMLSKTSSPTTFPLQILLF